MDVTYCKSAYVAVTVKTLWSQLKSMSSIQKVVISDLDTVYYSRRRRKKYAIIIIYHSLWRRGSPKALAMLEICLMNCRG